MIRKQLICYLLMTLLVVPMAWSQERAIRPANQQSNATKKIKQIDNLIFIIYFNLLSISQTHLKI